MLPHLRPEFQNAKDKFETVEREIAKLHQHNHPDHPAYAKDGEDSEEDDNADK